MTYRSVTACLTLLLLVCPFALPARAAHVPDEVIVRYRAGGKLHSASVVSSVGAKAKRPVAASGYQTLKLPKGAKLEDAIARLRKDPRVAYAGPNHILRICSEVWPSDPILLYGWDYLELGMIILYQWGLYNDGTGSGFGSTGVYRADIHAPEAWAINTGSPDMVIAVLDTGVDYTHPDLSPKMWHNPGEIAGNGIDDDQNGFVDDWRGWDFANDDNDPMDDHVDQGMAVHHGTFTAAIAAASTDDGVGMAGVSWGSPVMALKVMDANGYGLEDIAAEAVRYAADNGAKIINMSLTGENAPAMEDACNYAWEQGCLVVAASGNENLSVDTYPASYGTVLSVGASNESDQRCTAADWGQGGSNYGSYLDVMAPGNNILSVTDMMEPGGYFVLPGTSAAAPFVAGVAALVWSEHPDWTNQQVFNQIVRTCDDMGTAGWDALTGWGRVNAYRALSETPQQAAGIAQVKAMPSGTPISLTGAVLSTASDEIPGRMYVQSADRSSGLLLSVGSNAPAGLSAGDVVDVFGTVGQMAGECALLGASITKVSTASEPKALGMPNTVLGGGAFELQQGVVNQYSLPREMASGLNNIGLLVSTWGKVTAVGTDWFYIDDGAGLDDGGAYVGVYVHNGSLVRPGVGKYVTVTGISSCEMQSGSTVARRVLRPRRQSDIVVVK